MSAKKTVTVRRAVKFGVIPPAEHVANQDDPVQKAMNKVHRMRRIE